MLWKAERRRLSCGRGSTVSDVDDPTPVFVTRVWSEEAVAVEVRSQSRAGSRAVQATPQAAMSQEETGAANTFPVAIRPLADILDEKVNDTCQ